MKRLVLILLMAYAINSNAQCTIANYLTAFRIPATSYPYTSVSAGVTVSVTTNVTTLSDVAYTCNGNNYAGASPAWWLNASTQYVILKFSAPVTRFTVLVNGTNATEIFYYFTATGAITLADYCSTGMVPSGSQITYTPTPAGGSLISIVNPTGSTSYTMTHNGLGSGSRVTLLDCFLKLAPLPVELTEFTAQCRSNDVVELNWKTESELGNDFFAVERSYDAKNWETIAEVKGAGTSTTQKKYSYRDKNTSRQITYYRLKQNDITQNYKYTEIISVGDCSFTQTGIAELYPNPASNEVNVKLFSDGTSAVITDMYGDVLKEMELERGDNKIDVSQLQSGSYTVKLIQSNGEVLFKKLIIQTK